MNLTDINDVKALQSNLHAVFDTPQGKEVLHFLKVSCGWYESIFDPVNKDRILVNAGRREVVATIFTLLEVNAEAVVALAKAKEQ